MKKYIIVVVLFCFQGLLAQVQFETKVSKATLGINERLRVDFTMNEDGDNFIAPSFDGFRIIGGPNQSINYSWINGKKSYNKTYSYFLLPLQKGTIVIKQASIEIDNQIYKTAPLTINVTAAVDQSKDPNSPDYVPNATIYLVAEVSKTNPYINEPITVVYKMYFNNIGIRTWKELDSPKYNDFWSQNINIKELIPEEGNYNGEKYRFVVLRKTVLYPQKSGTLTIEPLTLDVAIQVPTNRRDILGDVMVTNTNKTITTGTKTITVKPLPEEGRPEDFSGAVGQFTFAVTPSRTSLKHEESLELNIAVTGKGNLKLFNLPKPTIPSALEMYDPIHNEKVTTTLVGTQGTVSDKYTLISQFKGDYAIKPMRFSYFDLNSKSYKTIQSPEVMISVLDGPSASDQVVSHSDKPGVEKRQVVSGDQFRFIQLKTNLKRINTKDFFNSGLFYFFLFAPLLIIPVIVITRKKKEAIDKDIVGNRIKLSNKLAKKYLSEAKKQIRNKEPFYIALEKAMHNFLKAKLDIETSEMSKDKIREILLSRKALPESVGSFIDLTENCDLARYAPSSKVTIQQDYDKAVTIISELEKQIV